MSAISLLQYTLENLVSHPDDIKITEVAGDDETILEVRVHEDDIGKVIGKGGSVARALRTIVGSISLKEDVNYVVEIID